MTTTIKGMSSSCLKGALSLLALLPATLLAQDATASAPASTATQSAELATGINTVWMLLAAMLVFFMQPGFALVEAGFTRAKNTANILMKNFIDFIFGSLSSGSSDSA